MKEGKLLTMQEMQEYRQHQMENRQRIQAIPDGKFTKTDIVNAISLEAAGLLTNLKTLWISNIDTR